MSTHLLDLYLKLRSVPCLSLLLLLLIFSGVLLPHMLMDVPLVSNLINTPSTTFQGGEWSGGWDPVTSGTYSRVPLISSRVDLCDSMVVGDQLERGLMGLALGISVPRLTN